MMRARINSTRVSQQRDRGRTTTFDSVFPPLILMKDHPQSSVSKFDVNHWNMLEAILNDKLYFDLFCLQYK